MSDLSVDVRIFRDEFATVQGDEAAVLDEFRTQKGDYILRKFPDYEVVDTSEYWYDVSGNLVELLAENWFAWSLRYILQRTGSSPRGEPLEEDDLKVDDTSPVPAKGPADDLATPSILQRALHRWFE
jgi:hypothetical protein